MNDTEYKEKRKIINPWKWQERFGFVQANDISGYQRIVMCSGQSSVDDEGMPVHKDDMRAQISQAMDNLEVVLKQADLDLSNVIRLNYYTTDIDRFFEAYDEVVKRLKEAGSMPASTLLGIKRLAFPELLVEIEATAVCCESIR